MNLPDYQSPSIIQDILKHSRIAIVGLSSNELRASHFVGFYLKRHGYDIIPVNPREESVLGATSYPSLLEVPGTVDVVDVFRDPAAVPEIAEQAVAIGAKALWLQFGVISEEGISIAEAAGLDVVADRCLKIEHARFLGRMHWLGFNTDVISARRKPT
jgi:predicted CoA-binding protein